MVSSFLQVGHCIKNARNEAIIMMPNPDVTTINERIFTISEFWSFFPIAIPIAQLKVAAIPNQTIIFLVFPACVGCIFISTDKNPNVKLTGARNAVKRHVGRPG